MTASLGLGIIDRGRAAGSAAVRAGGLARLGEVAYQHARVTRQPSSCFGWRSPGVRVLLEIRRLAGKSQLLLSFRVGGAQGHLVH